MVTRKATERERGESARRLRKEGRHTWGPKERERKHGAVNHHSGITVVTRKAKNIYGEREKEREKE